MGALPTEKDALGTELAPNDLFDATENAESCLPDTALFSRENEGALPTEENVADIAILSNLFDATENVGALPQKNASDNLGASPIVHF